MKIYEELPAVRRFTRWGLLLALLTAASVLPAAAPGPYAEAPGLLAGGDISIDFTAAAPFTYNHAIGGGAYDDRTVGVTADVVESLEGGQFSCGDIVTYLAAVSVDASPTDANQTVKLDFTFLANTTGQSGAAISSVEFVGVNRGTVSGGDGAGGTDSGLMDDGGSTATLLS